MKIVEVADLIPNKLGSFERYCIANARYLRERDHEHVLFFAGAPCPAVHEALERAGARVMDHCFRRLGFLNAVRLSAFVMKERADIVHLHFHEPFNLFTLLGRVLPCRVFVTYHISAALSTVPGWLGAFKRLRTTWMGAGVARVFCVSHSSRRRFLANYMAEPGLVSVVHNGIALEAFDGHRPLLPKAEHEPLRVVCVASLIPEKGVEDLIRAAALLNQEGTSLEVTVVGDGPMLPLLQDTALELGVGTIVRFLGLRTDVPQLLAQSHVAVVPSRWDEAFGFAVTEAMAAGLPVVASNVGGIPEIVVDGQTGFLIPPASPAEIARCLRELGRDPEVARRLGANGRRRVEREFRVETTCELHLEHYLAELEKR